MDDQELSMYVDKTEKIKTKEIQRNAGREINEIVNSWRNYQN